MRRPGATDCRVVTWIAMGLALGAMTPATPEPHAPSRPVAPATRGDGLGLMVFGGVFGAAMLAGRTTASASAIDALTCGLREHGVDACEDAGLVAGFSLLATDLLTAGLALPLGILAAGLERQGRWQGQLDARRGRVRPMGPGREVAGWTLLAVGTSTWVVTAAISVVACDEDVCLALVHESGFYMGAAMVGAAVALVPWTDGYRRGSRGVPPRISLAPTTFGRRFGLTVSGRF
jgi:hypothetical protein